MPAYDFRCKTCRHTFEVIRPARDTTAPECPECGSETKRVFTPIGVHFKGSGFYNTDHKGKSAAAETPAPSTEAKPDGGCPAAASGSCPGCAASGE